MKSDSELLEEVVITGYGSGQKLGSVVGSVTAVGSEKLEKKPVANVADALQGQVAGCKFSLQVVNQVNQYACVCVV